MAAEHSRDAARVTVGGLCEEEPPGLGGYLRKTLWVDLGWCLAVAVVLTLLVVNFVPGRGRVWPALLALNTIISIAIGMSVANSFRFLLPPLARRFPSRLGLGVSQVVIAILGTALGVEIAVRVVDAIGAIEAQDLRRDAFRVGLVVVGVILAFQFGYDRLRAQARRDELRAQEARREALRAELKALQARTNPHFLFNSLNTVAGLIEEDPAAAEQVIERLAGLFRYTLKGADGGWVRLSEEIDAVRGYLEVEGIRLGERLRSEISVAPEVAEVLVPPLVLQPLVENAVLHGVAPRKAGGRVRVDATQLDSQLLLSVADDGDGPGSSPHHGSGTALADLERRLGMVYRGDARLRSAAGAEGGYRVTLSLPLELPA